MILLAVTALAVATEQRGHVDVLSVPPVVTWNAVASWVGVIIGAVFGSLMSIICWLMKRGLDNLERTIQKLADRQVTFEDISGAKLSRLGETISELSGIIKGSQNTSPFNREIE
jgi:hypothetical protein